MVFDPQEKRRWTLGLEWRRHKSKTPGTGIPERIDYLEYLIDGQPLSELLKDDSGFAPAWLYEGDKPALGRVGVLQDENPGNPDTCLTGAHLVMLLGEEVKDRNYLGITRFSSNRVPVYVCECWEYNCGAICVRIDLPSKAVVVWHEFRFEPEYLLEGEGRPAQQRYSLAEKWFGIGPFYFDYEQYWNCLLNFPLKPIEQEAS